LGGAVGLLALIACASQPLPPPKPLPGGPVFNRALTQYGSWDEMPGLGAVWHPSTEVVGIGFVPYSSSGRWAWTDDGWVFLSDFGWGWATFHYGRWFYSPTYGWSWLPGSTWGAAWVDWRYGHGYVAWMPTPPRGAPAKERWQIVESRHFTSRDLMPHSIEETPLITAALAKPELAPDAPPPSPYPPKETIAKALGRSVPEPSAVEARAELVAKSAFGPVKKDPEKLESRPAAPPPAPTDAVAETEPRPRAEIRRSAPEPAKHHATSKAKKKKPKRPDRRLR
jgi:hypothetical protein